MSRKKKYKPKTIWGKLIYYPIQFFMGSIYYLTAVILSIVLVMGVIGFMGYKAYQNYYLEYLNVQESWINLDGEFIDDIAIVTHNHKSIETYLKENKELNTKENKLILSNTKNELKSIIEAMSYSEKISEYPKIFSIAKDLRILSEKLELETEFYNLSKIDNNNKELINTYNSKAQEWNTNSLFFPLDIISELASFHTWPYFK